MRGKEKYRVQSCYFEDARLGITPEALAQRHIDPARPFHILCRDGIPCPIESLSLIKTQASRMNRASTDACYARDFAAYLWDMYQIEDFTKVTATQLEAYVGYLHHEAQKSAASIVERIKTINRIYNTYVDYHYALDDSLFYGTQFTHVRSRRRTSKRRALAPKTMVYAIMKARIPKPAYTAYIQRMHAKPTGSKFLSDEEIAAVLATLPLRDAAIISLMLDTGFRNSSARTIQLNGIDLSAGTVSDCFAKTGILVEGAALSDKTRELLHRYILGERREIVAETGESPYLFLNRKGKYKGQAMTYAALYEALKRAQRSIAQKYPNLKDFCLRSHACRATFVTDLMHRQIEDFARGLPTISDVDIMTAAGVTSMNTLFSHYYDHASSEATTEKLREIANLRNERVNTYGYTANTG